MSEFYIGQILTKENYTAGAKWCNENNAWIVFTPEGYQIQALPEPEPLTYDEIEQIRAELYRQEVDPITSQISRLRDEPSTPELEARIAELIELRAEKVAKIKEENPYPPLEEGPGTEEESLVDESVVDEILSK